MDLMNMEIKLLHMEQPANLNHGGSQPSSPLTSTEQKNINIIAMSVHP